MHTSERAHFSFTSRSGFYQGWQNCQGGTIVKNRAEARQLFVGPSQGCTFPAPLGEAVPQQCGIAHRGKKWIFHVLRAVWRLLSVMLTQTEWSTKAALSTFPQHITPVLCSDVAPRRSLVLFLPPCSGFREFGGEEWRVGGLELL